MGNGVLRRDVQRVQSGRSADTFLTEAFLHPLARLTEAESSLRGSNTQMWGFK